MPWECRKKNPCSVGFILNYANVFMICAGVFIIFQIIKFISVLPGTYISFMVIMAAIIILCGVVGFVGISIESSCVTKVYAVIWLHLIIVQVIGIFLTHKFDDLIRGKVRNIVEIQWHEELVQPGAMDDFQIEFKCCGNNSSHDYINILHRAEIPSSCYYRYSLSNAMDRTLNTEGCFTGAVKTINNSYAVALRANWIGVVLTSILFAAVVYLVIEFTNGERRSNYQN